MDLFVNQLVNGLTSGAEYALIAAGLALIFGVLQIVNFAHGELYMLAAYYLYLLTSRFEVPYFVAVPLVVAAMALSGGIFYLLVIHRVIGRDWQIQLIATLAVSIILINTAIVLSGPTPQYVLSPISDEILHFGFVSLSAQRILVLVAAAASFAGLYWMLTFTKLGKAMRAVSQNREAALAAGISVTKVGLASVVVASVLAGVAGALIPPLYNVYPTMATLVIIKAFAAVIMGGFGNVTGAVIAAFLLGLVESAATTFVSAAWSDAVVFGFMILVLLVRPHGLFGYTARV